MKKLSKTEKLYRDKKFAEVIELTKDSNEPNKILACLACLAALDRFEDYKDFFHEKRDFLASKYPVRTMYLAFDICLMDEDYLALQEEIKLYEEGPYISQEAEEVLADFKNRLKEALAKPKYKDEEEEEKAIKKILLEGTDSEEISSLVREAADKSLDKYLNEIINVCQRNDITVFPRVFALMVLMNNEYHKKIKFLGRLEMHEVVPSKLTIPFIEKESMNVMKMINTLAKKNVTVLKTSEQILASYTMATYLEDGFCYGAETLANAIILIAKELLGESLEGVDQALLAIKNEVQDVIDEAIEPQPKIV